MYYPVGLKIVPLPMPFHLRLVLLYVLKGGFITNDLQAQNSAYLSNTEGNQ